MKKLVILLNCTLFFLSTLSPVSAQTGSKKKILIIGVDGVIYSAIPYTNTPGLDKLLSSGSYSMNGYAGLPANTSTGWSTLLTGVSVDKHAIRSKNDFSANQLSKYPSMVKRMKTENATIRIASIMREQAINTMLNADADIQYNHNTDSEVLERTRGLLQGQEADVILAQFSGPAEVGMTNGYHLRQASYILAIQQIDSYINELVETIRSRTTYSEENWAIFVVSTHGGTENGQLMNSTLEEVEVPIIFSGGNFDSKELLSATMSAKANGDNMLTINKATTAEATYGRIPISGTALQGMNKFTIEMWIKAGTNSSDPVIMGDKNWASGGNPGFAICRNGTSWKLNIANEKSLRYDISSSKSIEDSRWHHIAISFDKTKECIIFQDGERVGSTTLAYTEADKIGSPFAYLHLAQDGTGKYTDGGPNWAGSFNEIRIWTKPLSEETIKKYRYVRNIEQSNHPNIADLNLYLKMDETSGKTLIDHSGKNHHGELFGAAIQRNPYYPIGLTDVAINAMTHMGFSIDSSWNLDGNALRANVPYRLFKVN